MATSSAVITILRTGSPHRWIVVQSKPADVAKSSSYGAARAERVHGRGLLYGADNGDAAGGRSRPGHHGPDGRGRPGSCRGCARVECHTPSAQPRLVELSSVCARRRNHHIHGTPAGPVAHCLADHLGDRQPAARLQRRVPAVVPVERDGDVRAGVCADALTAGGIGRRRRIRVCAVPRKPAVAPADAHELRDAVGTAGPPSIRRSGEASRSRMVCCRVVVRGACQQLHARVLRRVRRMLGALVLLDAGARPPRAGPAARRHPRHAAHRSDRCEVSRGPLAVSVDASVVRGHVLLRWHHGRPSSRASRRVLVDVAHTTAGRERHLPGPDDVIACRRRDRLARASFRLSVATRGASPAAPPNTLDRVLMVLAAVGLGAAVVAAVTDIRLSVLGQRVSLASIDRPLLLAVVALSLWGWRMRRQLRSPLRFSHDRGVVAFYACMVVLMWLFSLGPSGYLPYSWLLHVPGVTGIRAPARFWMLAVLSLSMLAGFGVTRLGRGRASWVVAIVASAAIVVEGWVRVPAVPVHPFPFVQPDIVGAAVLELPLDSPEANIAAVLRATTGGYRTFNGYSGYEAPHFAPMRAGLRWRDPGIITALRQRTDLHVSVLSSNADGWRAWLARTYSDALMVGESPERTLYKLSRLEYTPPMVGGAVPFTVQHASCGAASARFVMDASLDTRWECGGATLGQQIVLDVGAVTRLSAVAPALGPYAFDAPRELRVETSADRAAWNTVWSGPIWAAAMAGGWEDEARIAALIPFTPVSARYVRLTQVGGDSGFYWSVAELQIFE
ncbi:MAG: discoidin domain-containing protein [Acidobacteria bacterium]|nr:discoidin domain-containing protein [Acidobacteriota bacterium]